MTDYFALLNESRRPWLDPAALKQKFLALSATAHPDKLSVGGVGEQADAAKSFAELNAAYHCLAGPKTRLLHLLELERGSRPADIQQIPRALAEVFAEVSVTCRDTDHFLAEKNRTTSPLLQVQFLERGQDWLEKLNALQQKLNGLQTQLMDRLKVLDELWTAAGAASRGGVLENIEELYRLFGYFNRWNKQIQDRVVELSL